MEVMGMTVLDAADHESPSRGLAQWRGGLQHMNPGDTLYPSYCVNARDDADAFGFKSEGTSNVVPATKAA
jgi:hypothetical protein